MPVYEYECTACAKVFEVQQRIDDDPMTACSSCGRAVKKLVSRSAFHLKGSGWYADGYGCKSDSSQQSAEAKKDSAAGEGAASPPPCQGAGGGDCKSCPAAV